MLQARAKKMIFEYVKARLERTGDHPTFSEDEVYIVWFNKTTETTWKALISTTLPDNMYYELTHDGFKAETIIEAYMMVERVVIPDPPPFVTPAPSVPPRFD